MGTGRDKRAGVGTDGRIRIETVGTAGAAARRQMTQALTTIDSNGKMAVRSDEVGVVRSADLTETIFTEVPGDIRITTTGKIPPKQIGIILTREINRRFGPGPIANGHQ